MLRGNLCTSTRRKEGKLAKNKTAAAAAAEAIEHNNGWIKGREEGRDGN